MSWSVNQVGANAQSVAEHTIALMLDVSRRISEGDRLLRRGRGFTREDIMGRETSGKIVGLVGIGHIGSRVAGLARAFGMTVLAFDPYLTEEEIARRGAVAVKMSELLERSDFRLVALPTGRQHAQHDGRGRVRQDEDGRSVHHHRARRHP